MNILRLALCLACAAISLAASPSLAGDDKSVRLAITTTIENSGLSRVVLPAFTDKTGIRVDLIVVGTGAALKFAERGDVDAVLVHAPDLERAFVAAGHASERRNVMYNHFLIAGPADDPAGIAKMTNATEALARIHDTKSQFVSRGDESGTHAKELVLWSMAGLNPHDFGAAWYRKTGSGMGATLNVAAGLGAYLLVDEGTWSTFANKQSLEALVAQDTRLLNQYGILLVNPERHAHVQKAHAREFMDWITSAEGQSLIGQHKAGDRQLFVPNYTPGS